MRPQSDYTMASAKAPGYIYRRMAYVTVRLVQVSIPEGQREAVKRTLADHDLDFIMTDETGNPRYVAVVYFPLPQEAVEPILSDLSAVGIDEETLTVVLEANTIVSRNFEALQEQYHVENDEDRVAQQELITTGEELLPSTRNYVLLTVVSAVVATAGLLLDSPAVVVGSMVIAPLVGPALAASIGTVVYDQALRRRGVLLQGVGITISIGAAAAFALLVRWTGIVPGGVDILGLRQIDHRLAPDFLSLMIAIGAGIAGAFSLSAGVSTALVGVMIAVALIPPAAAVGISIAWMIPELAMGSGVLVLINLLSINMVALGVLWYQGYRPDTWGEKQQVRRATLLRIGMLATGIVLLSAFLAGVTLANHTAATTEATIEAETTAVVETYEQLTLLDIAVETADHPLSGQPTQIVVTVGTTAPAPPPGSVATDLQQRLQPALSTTPPIEVRFVTIQTAGGDTPLRTS